MKKTILMSSLFVATALVSQSAMAEIKVRAGVANSTYKLSGDYLKGKSDYKPTNFGLTFASDGGLYLDLAISRGTGTHDIRNDPVYAPFQSASESFKREDAALIGGASFLNQNNGIAGTFYVGIKTGKTTLGCGISCVTRTSETLTTSGVVFGGGASFPIAQGRAGSVGVNLGVGIMGNKWEASEGASATADTAVGYSFGVSYTYPITSYFGVIADYKGNYYSYNFGDSNNPFKVNESISALGASLYAKF